MLKQWQRFKTMTDGGCTTNPKMFSLLTLQNQTTSTHMKIKHPPGVEVCRQIFNSSALLPSQWRAALPRLSGLVWPGPPPFPASSILPRASGHDHRERLSSFLSQPTHCLPSAPLSVAAWVTLSFRRCLYAVTGKSFLWCSKLWWIDHTVSDLD